MNKLLYLLLLFTSIVYSQDSIQSSKSIISLDKIKVLYRGISNPISIFVPKDTKDFSITIDNGSFIKVDKEKYEVTPSSGKELTIYVNMILEDNSSLIELHVYKIIELYAPKCTLNNCFSTGNYDFYFTIDELINAKVGVKFIDNFLMSGEVKGFNIKIPGSSTIVVNGNVFTDEVLYLLKKSRKKDIIIISEIKCNYIGLKGFIKKIAPFSFKIIE